MMLQYLITFLAVLATDLIYVYFLRAIQHDRLWPAAWWGAMVTFTANVAVINYADDHWALIPGMAGAFVGCVLGILIKRRQAKRGNAGSSSSTSGQH